MKVANTTTKLEMTSEEITVIVKIIGPTSHDSRKTEFNLTDEESNIAENIYDVLSNIVGDGND